MSAIEDFPIEMVPLEAMKPHPRNYQEHPDDQIEHIGASLGKHGYYKNVVLANDGTILAGHGVIKSARARGSTHAPARRMPYAPDSPEALEILTGDNEMSRLAERDDRLLSEILRDIRESDSETGLLGTGLDDAMLANLVMVTRPASEIASMNEANEWVGLPSYESPEVESIKLQVHFRNAGDREAFASLLDIELSDKTKSIWWPPKEGDDDVSSLLFADGLEDEYEQLTGNARAAD